MLFLPDRPSELQQTPCEELIPGLQTSSVDSTPQEDGTALSSQPQYFCSLYFSTFLGKMKHPCQEWLEFMPTSTSLAWFYAYVFNTKRTPSCFLVERPSTILDVDSGNSLLVVPDPFGTLEISDAPGKFLSLQFVVFFFFFYIAARAVCPSVFLDFLLFFDAFLEKLIEGLKSPDTSSLMLPDLLSLSDPFSGSVEESVKGVRF